jgi:hypothetical protein
VPRILIGVPVRQQPAVLRAFLDGLARLDLSGLDAAFVLVDDNDDPAASELLRGFRPPQGPAAVATPSGGPRLARPEGGATHFWNTALCWRVAQFKDFLLGHARRNGFDHVFLVDSDLVLRPEGVQALLACGRDIVSEVFWTSWQPGQPPLPNVWVSGQYGLHPRLPGEVLSDAEAARRAQAWLAEIRRPGLHRVGGLGACTLISRRALEAGVSFGFIDNVDYWGEDRYFCIRALVLGLELWAHTGCEPLHLYRDADLDRLPAWLAAHAAPEAVR